MIFINFFVDICFSIWYNLSVEGNKSLNEIKEREKEEYYEKGANTKNLKGRSQPNLAGIATLGKGDVPNELPTENSKRTSIV